MWTFVEVERWYGCDLDTDEQQLLAQYGFWAGRYEGKVPSVLNLEGKEIHRNLFELFLQDRELFPVRMAALRWGTDIESFESILNAACESKFISERERVGSFRGVYSRSFISDFHHRLPNFPRMIFASYSSYVRRLQCEIKTELGVPPKPMNCRTSEVLKQDPPELGYAFDCITSEPIGLGHQIWLDTGKPIQLPLDSCSWLTMAKFYESLNDVALGNFDEKFEENRESLRRAVQS